VRETVRVDTERRILSEYVAVTATTTTTTTTTTTAAASSSSSTHVPMVVQVTTAK
jgi:hypothetical protein